jgi:hypothetical protein
VDIDVEATEVVEAQLDTFIEKRAKQAGERRERALAHINREEGGRSNP